MMTEPAVSTGPRPAYTMILDQSAHLDWDWLVTFAQNYWYYIGPNPPRNTAGVDDIITTAIKNVIDYYPDYYYSVCEMGFFRKFLENHPKAIDDIKKVGDNFQVISGGVTSADCLVCSGEGFIRNYLLGQVWLKAATGLVPKPHCWLPDDFGQGPELPTLLAALGFVSVAFSRLPGTRPGCNAPSHQALLRTLLNGSVDFIWTASDGSSVLAHFLLDEVEDGAGYGFGNGVLETGIQPFVNAYKPTQPSETQPPSYSAAPTPFMYIPIDDDFSMPLDAQALNAKIQDWNTASAKSSNVNVVLGTFDQFIAGLLASKHSLKPLPYDGTPFFTGYYASRPELKALHYETVRALTAAEVIGLLTRPGNSSLKSMLPTDFWSRIDQTWTDFAPSTHHDYICGTAPDAVYAGDQLPLLRGAAAAARALRGIALNALGGMVAIDMTANVIVVNSLGFKRCGVAAIEGIRPSISALTWAGGSPTTTQDTAEGGMLVRATVDSFGYVVGQEAGAMVTGASVTMIQKGSGPASYTLSNECLTATITAEADWGIASLTDTANGGAEVLSTAAGTIGNAITFYDDSSHGGLYQFSNEYPDDAPAPGTLLPISDVTVETSGAGLGALVLETGPLRVRLRTEVMFTLTAPSSVAAPGGKVKMRFVREYTLHAGEPFLRMTTTGAAPVNTSVMTTFPLAAPVTAITHGTGYHWTDVQPAVGQPPSMQPVYWGAPVFRATHDFVLPCSENGRVLAAAYHASMPAWALDADGTLIGCLLRNTPNQSNHEVGGSDPAPHTQHYALRVPTGLGEPQTGQPLREAQSFHTPLLAALMPPTSANNRKTSLSALSASLASVAPDSAAVLTVAKPGSYDPTSLVLRLYQPTNAALTLDVALPEKPAGAELVTAAETAWSGGGSATPAEDAVTVEMTGAVATVSIPGMGRSG